jgi:hypothetical protein
VILCGSRIGVLKRSLLFLFESREKGRASESGHHVGGEPDFAVRDEKTLRIVR